MRSRCPRRSIPSNNVRPLASFTDTQATRVAATTTNTGGRRWARAAVWAVGVGTALAVADGDIVGDAEADALGVTRTDAGVVAWSLLCVSAVAAPTPPMLSTISPASTGDVKRPGDGSRR